MSFAEKWAAVEATYFETPNPMDKMDRMDTIQNEGNSVHCVHIVHNISTPKIGCPTPRTDPPAPAPDIPHGGPASHVRPSRATCQAQGCAMWTSGGPDDRACSWRCIGSIVHDGVDPEDADKPRLVDLDACPFIEKAHNQVAEVPTDLKQ